MQLVFRGAHLANQQLGLNPVGVAAGVKNSHDDPKILGFAIIERVGARPKNAHTPAVRPCVENERASLKQGDEPVVFGENGGSFRAGPRPGD